MRSLLPSVIVAFLPAVVVVAHTGPHNARHHQARQATTSSVTSSPTPASVPAGSAATTPPAASGSASTTSYTFTLAATDPTAVPLASITANQSSYATVPLDATPTAGTLPTYIPGAPPLPDLSKFVTTNYPAWDTPPPTDSDEVAQWKQDVANSGITIPDLSVTNQGGCPNNTAIATDATRCWWTCTGCVGPQDITECPTKNNWGLTYDDGPAFYTPNLLQYLDQKDLKATFFVVGSRVAQFPHTLQAQFIGQHQLAVHTWSHQPLTTQTNDEIIAELGWSKKIIKDVLGVTPNMMRPPFGDIDNRVRAISLAMGLTPVIWTRTSATSTFDTDDFNIHNGNTPVQKVLQNWENILTQAATMNNGFIVLEHDLFEESVEVATGYILPDALAHNPPFTIQPVTSCLGRTLADAYIETNNNSTNPPPNPNIGTAASNTTTAAGSDATKSHAGRQYSFNPMVVSALVVGVSGFAVGIFTTLRL